RDWIKKAAGFATTSLSSGESSSPGATTRPPDESGIWAIATWTSAAGLSTANAPCQLTTRPGAVDEFAPLPKFALGQLGRAGVGRVGGSTRNRGLSRPTPRSRRTQDPIGFGLAHGTLERTTRPIGCQPYARQRQALCICDGNPRCPGRRAARGSEGLGDFISEEQPASLQDRGESQDRARHGGYVLRGLEDGGLDGRLRIDPLAPRLVDHL